jgi:hypothetical protein
VEGENWVASEPGEGAKGKSLNLLLWAPSRINAPAFSEDLYRVFSPEQNIQAQWIELRDLTELSDISISIISTSTTVIFTPTTSRAKWRRK